MTKNTPIYIVAFIFSVLLLASCSKYSRILKSTDLDLKYESAMKYYQKEDYFRALQLFEELITLYRGTARGEEVYYSYAKCHYYTDDFVSAAYHFENFVKTYPNSAYAEEASFLNAYCYYLDSPISSLDQTNSLEALNQFQLFINRFPESKKVDTCNILMDELRYKQEQKAFNNAMLFFKMEEYKAATTSLGNMIKMFPGTRYREICLFNMLKSSYFYARQSIEEKKADRYRAAIENYYVFIDAYPKSALKSGADEIYADCRDELEKLSKPSTSKTKN